MRLDNIQLNIPFIKLLKLEAEGAEPEVIEEQKIFYKTLNTSQQILGPNEARITSKHIAQ